MAYDGNGNFNRLYNWQDDAANGVNILASRMDEEMDGFATGLSLAVLRDGQAAMQADFDLGNNKLIRVADPTLNTDGVNKKWVDDNFLVNSGTPKITGAAPFLVFNETDSIADLNQWHAGIANTTFTIRPLKSDGSSDTAFGYMQFLRDIAGITDIQAIGGSNWSATPPHPDSVITRVRGDGRYGTLSGVNLWTSRQVIEHGSSPSLALKTTDGITHKKQRWFVLSSNSFSMQSREADDSFVAHDLVFNYNASGATDMNFYIGGGVAAIIEVNGNSAPNSKTVITREKGDNRYFQLTGGTIAGSVEVESIFSKSFTNRSNGVTSVLRVVDGATVRGQLSVSDVSGANATQWQFQSSIRSLHVDTTNGIYVGRNRDESSPSTLSGANAGTRIAINGQIHSATSNGPPLMLNRTSSTGPGATFSQDGTVVGSISFLAGSVSFNTTSDRILKSNIKAANKRTIADSLKGLQVQSYDTTDGTAEAGLIAQEVAQAFPNVPGLVTPGYTNEDGTVIPWMMDYSRLIPSLVASVQNLIDRVEAMERGKP